MVPLKGLCKSDAKHYGDEIEACNSIIGLSVSYLQVTILRFFPVGVSAPALWVALVLKWITSLVLSPSLDSFFSSVSGTTARPLT